MLLIETVKDSEDGNRDKPAADSEEPADGSEDEPEDDVEGDAREIQPLRVDPAHAQRFDDPIDRHDVRRRA